MHIQQSDRLEKAGTNQEMTGVKVMEVYPSDLHPFHSPNKGRHFMHLTMSTQTVLSELQSTVARIHIALKVLRRREHRDWILLVTGATLVVTGALLVVTRSY